MAITSVTLLNSNGVDAALAKLREGSLQDFLAAQPQTSSSSVTRISVSGKALVSLDSLQAFAEAAKNANVPPTVSDFKVLVNGVVNGINALRQSVANAANSDNSLANSLQKRLDAIDQIASKSRESAAALSKIGLGQQDNGSFTVNQKQLLKSFNEDKEGAFAAFTNFAGKVSGAAGNNSSKDVEDTEKTKESNKSKEKDKPNANDEFGKQLNLNNTFDAPSSPAVSFVAKNAVASYLTIASL
jgi:hypothetical protein